jgi:hypothetical protein
MVCAEFKSNGEIFLRDAGERTLDADRPSHRKQLSGKGHFRWSGENFVAELHGCQFGQAHVQQGLRQGEAVWVLLTLPLLFLALSLNEVAQIHEGLGRRSNTFLADNSRKSTRFSQTGIWMLVIGLPFLALFVSLRFSLRSYFRRAPGSFTELFLGTLFTLAGAIGIETLFNFVAPKPSPKNTAKWCVAR